MRFNVSYRIRKEREDGTILNFGSDSKSFESLGSCLSFLEEIYKEDSYRFSRDNCLFMWNIFDFETKDNFYGELELEYGKYFIDSVTNIDLSQFKKA